MKIAEARGIKSLCSICKNQRPETVCFMPDCLIAKSVIDGWEQRSRNVEFLLGVLEEIVLAPTCSEPLKIANRALTAFRASEEK